jgi:hypothetical protein
VPEQLWVEAVVAGQAHLLAESLEPHAELCLLKTRASAGVDEEVALACPAVAQLRQQFVTFGDPHVHQGVELDWHIEVDVTQDASSLGPWPSRLLRLVVRPRHRVPAVVLLLHDAALAAMAEVAPALCSLVAGGMLGSRWMQGASEAVEARGGAQHHKEGSKHSFCQLSAHTLHLV